MSTKLFTLTILADTVGLWRFRDLTGKDESSSGNDLTNNGFDSSDLLTDGITESGVTVLEMNTTDTFTIAAGASSSDFEMGMSDFTIEAWVLMKSTVTGSDRSVLTKIAGSPAAGWSLTHGGTQEWGLNLGDGVVHLFLDSDFVANDNKFHLITGVVDRTASTLAWYIDGMFQVSKDISAITGNISSSISALTLKGISQEDVILWDEICVTKRILTATEIAVRYAGHGDPQIFVASGSAAVTSNIVASNLSSFDLQLRHPCDHVLADGSFKLSTCSRCNGTGIYFDIRFDQTGHPSILKIEDKLIQSLEKLVLTSENKFHEDIVLGIHDRIGGPIDDMIGIIRYDLIQGIATMKQNQRGVPNLSARAQIATLNKVEVDNDTATSLRYLVEITTVSGETAEVTGNIILAG